MVKRSQTYRNRISNIPLEWWRLQIGCSLLKHIHSLAFCNSDQITQMLTLHLAICLQHTSTSLPNHAPSLPREGLGECSSPPPVWKDLKQIGKNEERWRNEKRYQGDSPFTFAEYAPEIYYWRALIYFQGWETSLKCWLKPKLNWNNKTIALN